MSSVHNILRVTVCATHVPFVSALLTPGVQLRRHGGSGVSFLTAANSFPQILNNINDVKSKPAPFFKTNGPEFCTLVWRGVHYNCFVSGLRKLYSVFENADSVHPVTALAKLKYEVTLGCHFIGDTPGGRSLHAAPLSTAPCALGGSLQSNSQADPDNLFGTPDDFRSSGNVFDSCDNFLPVQ